MRIQAVQQEVGITKKNIRFYEEAGLIKPRRSSDNGYRDYDETDVETLLRVKLLRSLNIPIGEIKRLQEGLFTLEDCLRRHEIALDRQTSNIEKTKLMCEEMRNMGVQYAELDAQGMLSRMAELEKEGVRFMDVRQKDRGKKYVGPVIGGAIGVLFMLCLIALGVYARIKDGMPLAVMLIFVLVPSAVIIGLVTAFLQRAKEIRGGEEDAASKY